MAFSISSSIPSLRVDDRGGEVLLHLKGSLSVGSIAEIWDEAIEIARCARGRSLIVECTEVEYLDGSGVGLLVELRRSYGTEEGSLSIQGLSERLRGVLEAFGIEEIVHADPAEKQIRREGLAEEVGRFAVGFVKESVAAISYVGEVSAAFVFALRHPRTVRWRDAFLAAEKSGVNALPIVGLVGFLVGLIIAYQSSTQLVDYGAASYLGGMVSVTMIRELGPLMAAIVLAARSGSAYAAEIGTMKVNEEINALVTMGLDPLRFLAVPRMMAAMVMTPLLTIFSMLGGVLGGAVVARFGLDQSLHFFVDKALDLTDLSDLIGGLLKAVVFGILIAAVGCYRGLATKGGSSGVGDAATSAVVTGLVLIIVADGLFSIMFFTLGV